MPDSASSCSQADGDGRGRSLSASVFSRCSFAGSFCAAKNQRRSARRFLIAPPFLRLDQRDNRRPGSRTRRRSARRLLTTRVRRRRMHCEPQIHLLQASQAAICSPISSGQTRAALHEPRIGCSAAQFRTELLPSPSGRCWIKPWALRVNRGEQVRC
jgi:hypothetical protein